MRSASQAVASANRWHSNKTGMCLYTVQCYFSAPWSGPYAEWSWHHWGGQHHGDKNPPAGVPVYWHNSRSKYGHIAISLGNGRIRSTDWPGHGRIGNLTIDQMTRAWNLQYLGWSSRFSGGAIQGIGHAASHHAASHGGAATYLKKLHYGQRDSDSVRNLQKALNAHHLKAPGNITLPVTGYYGPKTDMVVRACQAQHGYGHDGARHSNVGPRQAGHLHLPGVR